MNWRRLPAEAAFFVWVSSSVEKTIGNCRKTYPAKTKKGALRTPFF